MPFVSVRVAGAITKEEKQRVIAEMTDVLVRVLGKDPAATTVVIDEVNPENWGSCGETVAVRRARNAPK